MKSRCVCVCMCVTRMTHHTTTHVVNSPYTTVDHLCQVLDNRCIMLNVLWKLFTLLHHPHWCTRDTQVFLDVTGSEVILYPTQQTNFVVPTRLGTTPFRESTFRFLCHSVLRLVCSSPGSRSPSWNPLPTFPFLIPQRNRKWFFFLESPVTSSQSREWLEILVITRLCARSWLSGN